MYDLSYRTADIMGTENERSIIMQTITRKITDAEAIYQKVESAWCGTEDVSERIKGLLLLAKELREYDDKRKRGER